jgi:hypothetical protein
MEGCIKLGGQKQIILERVLKYSRDDWITSALRAPVIRGWGWPKACSMQMSPLDDLMKINILAVS